MAVKFADLAQKERVIRKVIPFEGDEIKIFQPNAHEAEELYEIFREITEADSEVEEDENGELAGVESHEINQPLLIKRTYSIVTDLDFQDYTEEEIQSVLETHPIILSEIDEEILAMIAEIKLRKEEKRYSELTLAKANVIQMESAKEIASIVNKMDKLANVAKEDNLNKIEEMREKVKQRKLAKTDIAEVQKKHAETWGNPEWVEAIEKRIDEKSLL